MFASYDSSVMVVTSISCCCYELRRFVARLYYDVGERMSES